MHACVCMHISGLLGIYTAFNGTAPYCECFVIRSRTTSVLAASAVDTLGHPLDDDSVSSTVDTQSIHLCTLHAVRANLRAGEDRERKRRSESGRKTMQNMQQHIQTNLTKSNSQRLTFIRKGESRCDTLLVSSCSWPS